MAHQLIQRVGSTDYKASYEVKGDKVAVTLDGETREEAFENQGPLYKARDLLRMMVRDSHKAAA